MRKLYSYLLTIFLTLPLLTACSEEEAPDLDYDNWQVRNLEFFTEKMDVAKAAVAEARATYGKDWENHCDWRIYRSYLKTEHAVLTIEDSICVRIKTRGEGPGCPLYTDSVLVNYVGRTMPTYSYKEGRVFDHSGVYIDEAEVIHPVYAVPAALHVANTIEGFTTVLQHMHVGDRWEVYIPSALGYAASSMNASLPAYSTLIFDLELKGYCRAGSSFKDK